MSKYFTHVLYATGFITMLPLAQFFAPTAVLAVSGLQVGDAVGLLHAQHWGLLAFCFGALLVYAARHPDIRHPIVLAAGLEKLGLCVLVAMGWTTPALQGMHPVLVIDGLCVILYALWWFTVPVGKA
ncbi:MAG: hypothetical protein Q8R67_07410 [Rhodoferax sp.]|nr:hypothetical protein [Rhodoferax sp.]MDP3651493.1 hypothetical protein [Rhodoferax sp.]